MDLTPALTISTAATTKSPDVDSETPPQISNRHHRHHHLALPQPTMVTYRECLKNHAASIGGYALDGCGEFMPSLTTSFADPTSLNCAACGCHRNFHRREPEYPLPHHRHFRLHSSWLQLQSQQSPSPTSSRSPSPTTSPSSPTPLPISHLPPRYYASAPRVLLSLNTGHSCLLEERDPNANPIVLKAENANGRKRMRSKFSHEQKARMHGFAEKMGWRLQKIDERLVEEFCNEIGIDKRVLKIWIHNNKQSLMKGEKLFNDRSNGDKDSNNVESGGGRQSLIDAIADKADNGRNEGTNFRAFLHGSSSSS